MTCQPARKLTRGKEREVEQLFQEIATNTIGRFLRTSQELETFIQTSDEAAVSALACDIQHAMTAMVRMGVAYGDALTFAKQLNDDRVRPVRTHDVNYIIELQGLRNEFVRFIADALYTGCECLEPDGRKIIQDIRKSLEGS